MDTSSVETITALLDVMAASEIYVCLLNAEGEPTVIGEQLRAWLAAEPNLLAGEGTLERSGRQWSVKRYALADGQRACIVTPYNSSEFCDHREGQILEALIEASPVAILTLDLDMCVTMWNPGCERIFGWTCSEVLGKPYPLVPQDEWGRFETFYKSVIEGNGFTGVEAPRSRKDGEEIFTMISTAPIKGGDGVVVGAMAILEDITERKQLESRLEESARLESIGRLAGGVAHDFNNLLTVITSYAETLLREPDAASVSQAAEAIQHSAVQATKLTQQLLAFSRQQVMRVETVDINQVISSTCEMLGRLVGPNIDIQTELGAVEGWVQIDPSLLEQTLMNLAANARDAMPKGGELRLSTLRKYRDGSPWVQLSVSDTGFGMGPEIIARIFEPFFTTKEIGKGNGLGLASVHGIVHQSGGEVDVVSEIGVGSTFHITIPISEAPSDAELDSDEHSTPSMTAVILLAEDNPQVQKALINMLRVKDHEVLVAGDGVEALEVAATHDGDIDVLLTDIVMPRMGGYELAQRFRKIRPTTKVIFMSGYADDEASRRDAGEAKHFLQKPFTAAQIHRTVDEALKTPVTIF